MYIEYFLIGCRKLSKMPEINMRQPLVKTKILEVFTSISDVRYQTLSELHNFVILKGFYRSLHFQYVRFYSSFDITVLEILFSSRLNLSSLIAFSKSRADSFSLSAPVLSSVPQGSILSPLTYVADLSGLLKSPHAFYADNLKIYDVSSDHQKIKTDLL